MIGLAVGHDGTTNQSNRAPALVMAGLASLILLAVTRSLVPLLAGATYDLNQRILLDVGSIDRPLAVAPILFGAVWLLGWRCRDGGLQAIHGSMIILATVSPSFTPFAILTAIPMLLEDSGTRTESRWTAFSILVLIGIVGGLVSSRSGFDLEENRLADLPAVLRNIPARGNLYLERDWGDFLARCPWVRPPMVTSDTRAYTNGVLEDHEKILLGANQDLLNAYGIDTVIVRPDRPLARTLQHVPGWVVNGQNDDRIILTRWTWFQGGPPPYIEFPQRPN